MSAIWSKIVLIINTTKIVIERLEKWIRIEINDNRKQVIIILLYWIPQSLSNRVYSTLIQYNKMEGKAKIITEYRNEILNEIQAYVKANDTINDIIVVGD